MELSNRNIACASIKMIIEAALANCAIRTGRKLHFDPVTMRFINDPAANALAEQPMRLPWSLH